MYSLEYKKLEKNTWKKSNFFKIEITQKSAKKWRLRTNFKMEKRPRWAGKSLAPHWVLTMSPFDLQNRKQNHIWCKNQLHGLTRVRKTWKENHEKNRIFEVQKTQNTAKKWRLRTNSKMEWETVMSRKNVSSTLSPHNKSLSFAKPKTQSHFIQKPTAWTH